jgi:hypothetical protein
MDVVDFAKKAEQMGAREIFEFDRQGRHDERLRH